jgi:hypothetical protein
MTAPKNSPGQKTQKPVKAERNTAAKRIRALASTDIHAAMHRAEKGREVSVMERQFDLYFKALRELHQIKAGGKTPYQTALEMESTAAGVAEMWFSKNSGNNLDVESLAERLQVEAGKKAAKEIALVQMLVERDRARFCKMFIDALDARDSQKFFEVGRALEQPKKPDSNDNKRGAILGLKLVAELTKTSLTVSEVAEMVDWPQIKPDDGYSRLRTLCKELGYPLAASRKTSGK